MLACFRELLLGALDVQPGSFDLLVEVCALLRTLALLALFFFATFALGGVIDLRRRVRFRCVVGLRCCGR